MADKKDPIALLDKFFGVVFGFCALIGIGFLVGVVWLIAYVVPHIVHLLDRIQ